MNRFTRSQRLILLLILLLAFALRLYRLGADSLWYDETVSALLAAKSLPAMWAHTAADIHPPLYYALLHFWTAAAGRSEFAYAFLSLWFGVALIPLIAYLGRRIYGRRLGLLAAFLAAINPFDIWYAQEVRMYTLGTFLLTLILILTLDYLQKPAQRRSLSGYALLAALAMWTLYYSAFALIALNIFVILWLWRRPGAKLAPWLLAQLAALILYLPWLPTALRQAFDPPVPPWREPVPFGQLLGNAFREGTTALSLGQSLDPTRWWPLGLLFLAITLFSGQARRKTGPALLWVSLFGPPILILVASQFLTPLYHVRYLNLYAAAFPILLAAGLLHLSAPRRPGLASLRQAQADILPPRPLTLPLLLILLLLVPTALSLRNFYNDRYNFEAADDLRAAVHLIYEELGPRDAVLINAGYLYPAFVTYWPHEIGWLGRLSEVGTAKKVGEGPLVVTAGHIDGDPDIGWGDPASDFYAITGAEAAARLTDLFAAHNTIWLLRGYDTVNDPDGFIRAWLSDHGELLLDQVFPGQTFVRVQAWRTTQQPRPQPRIVTYPPAADFSGGIRLLDYDLTPPRLQPGHPLRLSLIWQRTGEIDRPWKIFTQLLDPGGNVIAQDDAQPLGGAHPSDRWQPGEVVESSFVLHPPPSLPSGDYRLLTGFYDESNGERLQLANGDDAVTLVILSLP